MTSFKATFWQWIPSIKRSLSLIGDGCVMDTRSIGDMRPIYSQMVPESDGKVQSVVPFYYRGGKHLCLLSDYGRDGALESAKATLVVKRGRSDDRIDVEMILDRDGLMSMHLDAGDPSMAEDMDGIAESLFDSIIGLYHTHAHPRGENVIGFYKGEDRSEALEGYAVHTKGA